MTNHNRSLGTLGTSWDFHSLLVSQIRPLAASCLTHRASNWKVQINSVNASQVSLQTLWLILEIQFSTSEKLSLTAAGSLSHSLNYKPTVQTPKLTPKLCQSFKTWNSS